MAWATGPSGVEDRSASTYTAVFTFDTAVTSGNATVTGGTATAGTPTFSGSEMRVPLSGVANAQNVTLHLSGVNGGTAMTDVVFGFLIGDIDSSRLVDRADTSAVKGQQGLPVTGANFRDDAVADGIIKNSDVRTVKTAQGTILP